jgi:hypothetical protein
MFPEEHGIAGTEVLLILWYSIFTHNLKLGANHVSEGNECHIQ